MTNDENNCDNAPASIREAREAGLPPPDGVRPGTIINNAMWNGEFWEYVDPQAFWDRYRASRGLS
jgi:hypothetical protein